MRILWCRLTLGNPFPVPCLCKLNHISVCFIQISTKINCKQLIPFRESHVFFEVIPGVLGRSVNFNILRRPVFPDYPFLVTMVRSISKPSFISQKIFSKNFVAILERKPVLTLNKPIYVGFSILDLSKYFMYEFHYKYIKSYAKLMLNCCLLIQTG